MKNCTTCQHCIDSRNVWDQVFDQKVWIYYCENHHEWFYGTLACSNYKRNKNGEDS